jgi:hypothetical protein
MRTLIAAFAVPLALTATGCSNSTPSSRSASSAPTAGPSSNAPAALMTHKFGQTAQLNGVQLTATITKVKGITSSRYLGVAKGMPVVALRVKVVNHSLRPVDVSLASVILSVGADGTQADQVHEVSNDGLAGSVQPGGVRTGVFRFVVAAADLGQVTAEIAPDGGATLPSMTYEGAVVG